MTVEIRPLHADEMGQFIENLEIGFSESIHNRQLAERPPEIQPEWTLCAFDDGELATTYAAFPFTFYMNGASAPAAGVTAVSTLPWQRRRGHLRRIMEHDFQRMHENGGPALAVLYASMAAIYQRFGYSVVSTHLRYVVEPRHVEFTKPLPVRGRFRTFQRDDLAVVKQVYERFAVERTGYIQRGDHEWQHLTIGYGKEQPITVAYEEDGTTLGYVVYWAAQRPHDSMQFGTTVEANVGDLTWLTPSAYQALWGYLRGIDLARRITCYRMPFDDPAKHLLLEPRMLQAAEYDGLLARIVDVEHALTQRGYDSEGRVTFDVTDEMAPWNTGRWELEASPDGARVRRTERDAQVSLPIGTLASLLFGHFSASQAARMGRLTTNEPAALQSWNDLFRTRFPPSCADGF